MISHRIKPLLLVAQGTSTRGSEDSFVTGRRDGVGTKAEKELTKLFERWLNSITSVLRAAIFGDDSVRTLLFMY